MSKLLDQFSEQIKEVKNLSTDTIEVKVNELQPHPKNRFIITEEAVEEIARDIDEFGLNGRLVVRQLDKTHELYKKDQPYQVLIGHKRRQAIMKLGWDTVEAKVIKCSDLEAYERLASDNLNARVISPAEILALVEDLTEFYEKEKVETKTKGRVQELIASKLELSPTQVGRYSRVLKKGSELLKELVKNEDLTLKNADELCRLSEDDQDSFLTMNDSYTYDEVCRYVKNTLDVEGVSVSVRTTEVEEEELFDTNYQSRSHEQETDYEEEESAKFEEEKKVETKPAEQPTNTKVEEEDEGEQFTIDDYRQDEDNQAMFHVGIIKKQVSFLQSIYKDSSSKEEKKLLDALEKAINYFEKIVK